MKPSHASSERRPAWLVDKVRRVLRSHQRYAELVEGAELTWPGLMERIDELTGVRIPDERLRQFALGVKTDEGLLHFPRLLDERLEAVIAYITDPNENLITLQELESESHAYPPPVCLLDFLRANLSEPDEEPSARLEGRLVARSERGTLIDVIFLTMERSAPNLYFVSEVHRTFANTPETEIDLESEAAQNAISLSTKRSTGWAVVTPEDNLTIMLKDAKNFNNHHWILLQDADLWSRDSVGEIALLRQAFPWDAVATLSDRVALLGAMHDNLARDLFIFQRVEGEPDVPSI